VPVATIGTSPFVLIGKTALPARNTAELIQLAKAQPGKLNFGTDGVGTSLHITAELFKQRAGLDLVHVPYKSGPQVLTDVAGGQVDLAVLPLSLAQPFIKDGKVRAFGVTSLARSPSAPAIPALAESAELKGLEMDAWLGVLAPAGTPAAVTSAWVAALDATLKDPEIARKLGEIAVKPQLIAGPAFAEYLAKERKAIAGVVQTAGIKVE
jgi:tripartite-type tricarboxylate transporter receptor subunit TctC